MTKLLRLMCIIAHPDDESLGMGPALARYAAQGVELSVICATRGERGWFGEADKNPGLEALGKLREQELRAAAHVLQITDLHLLDYIDGELAQVNPVEAIGELTAHIRRFRPQVVITFDPFGAYGHPDHIAVCQWTSAALVAAAAPDYAASMGRSPALPAPPHTVAKLYYMADTTEFVDAYEAVAGELIFHVNGEERRSVAWPPWAVTTRLDAGEQWQTVWQAITCHVSQTAEFQPFAKGHEQLLRYLCSIRTYYRAYSLVNVGPGLETDLFAGLR